MSTLNEQLGSEPIGKLLLEFSIPAIAGMLVSSLYNLLDRIFVGRLGALAMTGIGLTLPFMTLLTAFTSLVGIGTSAIVSMRLGQNRKEDAEKVLGNAFSMLTVLMLVVTVIGLIFKEPILTLLGASEMTMGYASDYITIILIGSVFQGIGAGLSNVIRAEGHPAKATIVLVIGTVLDMILNPLFIFTFNMGIAGAAWTTVLSATVTTILVIAHFVGKKSVLKLRIVNLKLSLPIVKDILSIGLSPFFMQIAAFIVGIISNNALKTYGGDVAIGAMTVVNAVMILFLMSAMGITQGAQPILGFNYGAQQYDRVKKTLKLELALVTAICVFTFLMVQFFPTGLARILSNDLELINAASHGMKLFLLMLPIIGAQIVGASYFQAVGAAKKATFLGLLRQVITLIPMLIILPNFFGLTGVWAAAPTSDFISCSVAIVFVAREIKRLGKAEQHQAEVIEHRSLS
ncbi:MATE family efflux transporter [Paenibacillus graminis]|uniref:MATE family efflux transporter n=1 Tax=Paenibacillus graminis TaxID=189425 RepID=UPI002DBA0688|nr:MATE family efflux transporter [Paenibacillus graminis]MEC0171428.1 MATE family efflux transporter [Paenibacillus graminis]